MAQGVEDAAGTELLARARRLCLAAREIQLPVLSAAAGRGEGGDGCEAAKQGRGTTPECEIIIPGKREQATLPRIPLAPGATGGVSQKEVAKQRGGKERRVVGEAQRMKEERKKHEREVETVKQAQQRARARVLRTNQLEQQEALRASEQQQMEAQGAAELVAEKMRRAEESRLRAEERLRMRRHTKSSHTPPGSAPSATQLNITEPGKLKAFRRKTMQRLHTINRHAVRNERRDTPERNEDVDPYQKLIERKLRQETAARLRRMKQLEEDQKRQEQEEFEQGLQRYKSKLRELDCVAKGFSKLTRQPSQLKFPTTEGTAEMESAPPPSAETRSPIPVHGQAMNLTNFVELSDSESSDGADIPSVESPRAAATRTQGDGCKLPPWKKTLVPVQPIQCKTIIRTYGRASFTAPGYTAIHLGSATRLRAHEISRHMN